LHAFGPLGDAHRDSANARQLQHAVGNAGGQRLEKFLRFAFDYLFGDRADLPVVDRIFDPVAVSGRAQSESTSTSTLNSWGCSRSAGRTP